ncbi:MAG TPA: sodium:calcium antiporter [Candidatus Nanoarchaeia archaeon]|nr:sodium:calcium antiporter [Candidatus Nanoarchaeia archaeon]
MVESVLRLAAGGYPKFYLIFILVASLLIMIKSADLLLYGVTRYFKRIGLSEYIVGLVVVAAVASFPELISSITGASLGDHGIVFGAILGSNVGGLTLILGIMALVSGKLNIQSKLFTNVRLIVFLATILPIILVSDGTLSRLDGVFLVATYATYLFFVFRKEDGGGGLKERVQLSKIWKDGLVFLMAFGALLLSSRWLIFGVIELSKRLHISSFIVSVVILGIGAQIPDLIVILRSKASGHEDVGMGDLLGSTLTKQLLFLGLIALFVPLVIPVKLILISAIAFSLVMGLVLLFMKSGWLDWKHGVLFLVIYCVYILLEITLNA